MHTTRQEQPGVNRVKPFQFIQPVSRKVDHESKKDANTITASSPVYNFSELPIYSKTAVKVQPKLTINQLGDRYEQEADIVADKIMSMREKDAHHHTLTGMGAIHLKSLSTEDAGELLQRKEFGATAPLATPAVKETLGSSGHPMDHSTRSFMELRFGSDFSQVRIHNNPLAHQSAKEINALAYTYQNNIVFNREQYHPGTAKGKKLLAHELTHVLQQRPSDTTATFPALRHQANDQIAREPVTDPSPLTIPSEGIDMPWVGKGSTNSSDLGYLRDQRFFWAQFQASYNSQLSPANCTRIANGAAPVVDTEWVRHYPQHAAYMGDTLEHHHVGQGSRAVPLPSRLHDAYTVFHPQRRVVGTPQGGATPLPPQPTRTQAQAEIDRHVRAGRIRGQGISPTSPPVAPTIPPASAVAGSPPVITGAVSTTPRAGSIKGTIPATGVPAGGLTPARPITAGPRMRGGGTFGGRMGGAAAAGLGALIEAIAVPIINHYLQQYYASSIQEEARELVSKAIEAHRAKYEALIQSRIDEIRKVQGEGRNVILHVAVNTNWVDTDIGRVLTKAEVGSYQIVFEEGAPPKPHSAPSPGGWVGGIVRDLSGVTLTYESFDIVLTGTDPTARHFRESRKRIDGLMRQPSGQFLEFEELILRSYYGDLAREELLDYTKYKMTTTEASGDAQANVYWNKMRMLTEGPLDDVITQAKIKSLPLARLQEYAKSRIKAAGQSGDAGLGADASQYWSGISSQIDAPLEDRYKGDRQRFLWTQPGTTQEIEQQKVKIFSLEKRLSALELHHLQLSKTDARTQQEFRGAEPPHPPWAKMRSIAEEITRLKEDIGVEKQLLEDLAHPRIRQRK